MQKERSKKKAKKPGDREEGEQRENSPEKIERRKKIRRKFLS